ncbi:MAG: NADH-quinone oxidoreductase subunit D [bacterium]|nr:NADH-quinone oxidoreductase subunit D [bacterium]
MSQLVEHRQPPGRGPLDRLIARAGARVAGPGLFVSQGEPASLAELASLLRPDQPEAPRLLDLWAWDEGGRRGVELLIGQGPDLLWHSAGLGRDVRYPGAGHLLLAAHWLERELAGVTPVRPLTRPEPAPLDVRADGLERPLRDTQGVGVFTIPFGPVRSGVVESLLYDVATAGEDMVHVAVRPGAKRRALEARLCQLPPELAPLVAERIAGVFSVAGALAVCQAIEAAAGVDVAPEAAAVRAVLAELERVFNHCDVILRLCDDASLSVGVAQMGILKERILRLLAALTGHRYGRGMVVLGGVRGGLDPATLRRELDAFERDGRRVRRLLLSTSSFLDRLERTGRLSVDDAAALGASGPVARGSGLPWDARCERAYGAYRRLQLLPAVMSDCDAMARFEVRLAEIRDSLRLIRELDVACNLASPPPPLPVALEAGAAGVGTVEAPEGEWVVSVLAGPNGRLRRCRVRPASVLNFACFPVACRGWVLTDFAFIEHSFGLSVAGRDR